VSVACGGCVSRADVAHLDVGARERLVLEDPLTGRDVATGSYRIDAVQAAFRRAARRLEQLASQHHNSGSGKGRVNYLEGLFDVQRVLSRDGKGGGKGGGSRRRDGGVVADEYYVLGRGDAYKVSFSVRGLPGAFPHWLTMHTS
jgi:hypothetical protein